MNKNGVFDYPDEKYFSIDALSNSYLWQVVNKTPAHAQVKLRKTENMIIGSALHLAVLQPSLSDTKLLQGPPDRRGKKWTELKKRADKLDAILLVEKDYLQIMKMRDSIWHNSYLASILSEKNPQYEKTALFEHRGLQCKLKLDCFSKNIKIDLKTTQDASPKSFSQSVIKFGYHQQAASYNYGWNKASGCSAQDFLFLVIEKHPPYEATVYELDAPSMAEGWASYNKAIDLHLECKKNNFFHGYPKEKQYLQIPKYGFLHTNPNQLNLKGE